MEYKRMLNGGGTVKNGKRTQWSKAYDKDGKKIDFSKHNKDWFDEYGEPACENKRMNMNKKSIRLTESDIKRIVRESVNRILREEWESPLDKAKKKRNDFDNVKKIDLSKFEKKSKKPKAGTFGDLPSFAKLKNRKDESRANRVLKGRMLKEWDNGYPVTVDDDENVYYGNYYYKTNDFKSTGQKFWVLTNNGTPEYAFVSPEEAAQYVVASIQDRDIEADVDEEQIYNEIMQSSDESGWYYKNYGCTQTDVVKKKQ